MLHAQLYVGLQRSASFSELPGHLHLACCQDARPHLEALRLPRKYLINSLSFCQVYDFQGEEKGHGTHTLPHADGGLAHWRYSWVPTSVHAPLYFIKAQDAGLFQIQQEVKTILPILGTSLVDLLTIQSLGTVVTKVLKMSCISSEYQQRLKAFKNSPIQCCSNTNYIQDAMITGPDRTLRYCLCSPEA